MKTAATGGAGCLLVLAIVALAAVLSGVIFFLVWNDFVIQHLDGAHHTSFGASMLVGLGVGALTGASNTRSS